MSLPGPVRADHRVAGLLDRGVEHLFGVGEALDHVVVDEQLLAIADLHQAWHVGSGGSDGGQYEQG